MGTLYRRKSSAKWYGEFTDGSGKRVQRSTGTNIKRSAERILAQWVTDANEQLHGITISPDTTIDTLLAEFSAFSNGSAKHVEATENYIRRVIGATSMVYPRDINRIAVETAVKSFQTPHGQPISLRSRAAYYTAIKSFTKWMTELRQALPRDPLAGLKRPSAERDRKRQRRYLLPDEWYWLSQTPNALIYETAIATGFRASELRALNRHSLRPDHLVLDGRHTKNGKPATQYISADLRERLVGVLPFDLPTRTAELLRSDLAIAKELWLSVGPQPHGHGFLEPIYASRVLDFHALRHTCGAWLAIANVGVKVIQSVMRHSTITLTLDTYGHLLPSDEQEASQRLSVILTQSRAG